MITDINVFLVFKSEGIWVLEGSVNIVTNGGDGNKGQDGANGRKAPDSLDKVHVWQEAFSGVHH